MKSLLVLVLSVVALEAFAGPKPRISGTCTVTQEGRRAVSSFRLIPVDPRGHYGLLASGRSRSGVEVALFDMRVDGDITANVRFPTGGYSTSEQVTITNRGRVTNIVISDSDARDGTVSCNLNVVWRPRG